MNAPFRPLHIVGAGLCTHAGTDNPAQIGAFLAGFSGARPEPSIKISSGGEADDQLLKIAPIDDPGLPDDYSQRLAAMLESAVDSALRDVADGYLHDHLAVYIVGPSADRVSGAEVDRAHLESAISNADPRLVGARIEWFGAENASQGALGKAIEDVSDGSCSTAIVAGVDSLLHLATFKRLAVEGRFADGVIPGEAAAGIVLSCNGAEHSLARIDGISTRVEPNAGRADEMTTNALAEALRAAMAQASLDDQALRSLWLTSGDLSSTLEWYQTKRRLWFPKVPKHLHHALELGVIEPPDLDDPAPRVHRLPSVFGELGAAALPVAIALVAAEYRMQRQMKRYGFQAPAPTAVCELGEHGTRTAVCITP